MEKIHKNYQKYTYYYRKYLENKQEKEKFKQAISDAQKERDQYKEKQEKLIQVVLEVLDRMFEIKSDKEENSHVKQTLDQLQNQIVESIIKLDLTAEIIHRDQSRVSSFHSLQKEGKVETKQSS